MPSYPNYDYYKTLGVDPSAPQEVITVAAKALKTKHHPDDKPPEEQNAATEISKRIGEAYECLKDPERRRDYDLWREQQPQAERQPSTPLT